MSIFRPLTLGVAAALGFTSCALAPRVSDRSEPTSVLLVSIDAFRADYLDRRITPNLTRIAHDGVRAQWMTPSYPSLTFPNHYTLVTGLRPDHHGIVHNYLHDPRLGTFKASSDVAMAQSELWGGEPIWVGAEKAGLPTATMFWPGSQAAIGGVRPTRWMPFDDTVPMEKRVDTVLDWLSEPPATRPRLATLYFEAVDRTSHDFGPDSPRTDATIREVDAAIGRLWRGLASRRLKGRVDLVIVSDHGMAPLPPGHTLVLEDLVAPTDATSVGTGEVLGFLPRPGHDRAAEAQLLGRHAHYQCWRKNEMPARWQYGTHPRIPPIVCQMDLGWDAVPREELAKSPPGRTRGSHGYDPDTIDMRAMFIAEGPSFRTGTMLPPFDNVDVYPMLAHLLGIAAAPNDGDLAPLRPALREDGSDP